ncbi:thermonuclease family protein [Pseudooceanicola sp. MF1-13]|uniref:thermonuclease family protein n=1 Tax=Pseudooceanicola sp. MF1-13 TaxID=3379095 RepID=UPI003891AA93
MSNIIPISSRPRKSRRRGRQGTPGYVWLVVFAVFFLAWKQDGILKELHSLIAPDKALSGPVTHVRDGDTIEVAGVPVRLAKLDCAERGTSDGRRASDHMRKLVRGQQMTCTLEGRKSYDREVGECALGDGRDVGEVMISEGYCPRWRW